VTRTRLTEAASAAAALSTCAGYLAWWTRLAEGGQFVPVDFDAFYTGAAIVRDGFATSLYDLGVQARYQLVLLGFLPLRGGPLPFVSPPAVAVFLAPLASLPLADAHRVWTALQLVLVAVLGAGVWRGTERPAEKALALAAALSFPMLFVTLYKGQVSLIALLALLGWWSGLRRENDRACGLCLVAFAVKPQLFLVPLLITALRRRLRALAWFAAGSFAVGLITLAAAGPAVFSDFLRVTRALELTYDDQLVYPAFMYNLRGFVTLLGAGPEQAIALTRAGLAAAIAAVLLLGWRGARDDGLDDLRVAASLLLAIFFTPHLYFYDTLLLVAAAAPFHAWLRRTAPARATAFLLVALAVPGLFLETAWFRVGERIVRWPVVVMALWLAWIAVEARRAARRGAGSPAPGP
jgi:hypothetical protein